MLEPRIQQHFFESADLIYQVSEVMAPMLEQAAQALTECLTSGNKVLIDAQEPMWAQYFCHLLLSRFERDRPGLAAVALSPAALADAQLRAIGHPGDVLIVISAQVEPRLQSLMADAQGNDMGVVALVGDASAQWRSLMRDSDVLVNVPHTRAARVHELHLLCIHALCDAIDAQLLGDVG